MRSRGIYEVKGCMSSRGIYDVLGGICGQGGVYEVK